MKCPKCGYTRNMGETAPDWQCPSCGIAYAKAGAAGSGIARAERRPRSGGTGLGRFLLAIFAIAIVWGLVQVTRQAPVPTKRWESGGASVVMYSLTTCGYCNAKRAQLQARGIPFVEYFIDKDRERQRELFEKLLVSGYRGRGVGTPTFEVNGKMLPNNPSLETIIEHL